MKSIGLRLLLIVLTLIILSGCTITDFENNTQQTTPVTTASAIVPDIHIDGTYSTPETVAEYIHLYKKLPGNFITKKEATALGWESNKGNLWEITDKQSIGGDNFGNREGKLPSIKGRKWYECDVNYKGGYRGSERILYSSDDLIYYTKDHYQTFTQLY
ncbi:ribonuclease domain-containing protein [Cohnella abietis]|uniref:Ribonuclease n=1 Tax=Cohnella abietis TaxID=2507935 RepID=A0A3T1D3K5_9BACL|nr:hypothetical protein KCTCHS21_20860 [Cohnella abietis]